MVVEQEAIRQLRQEVEELRRLVLQEHGRTHEIAQGDEYRPAIKNSGTLLDRQRAINFSTGLTASVDSANKEIDVVADQLELVDADGDTKIQVEESPDEDIIRLDAGGTEIMTVGREGAVDIFHTAVAAQEHALEVDIDAAGFGGVLGTEMEYDTGALSLGEDEAVILINIDESDAGGGDVAAIEVLATEGSAVIFALEVGAVIHPIEHLSGVFADMDSALVNAVDRLTEFTTADPGGANNVEIFSAQNNTVTIGDANKFEELEFLLETVASGGGIKPTFEFSSGAGPAYTAFSPIDGTEGMRHTGVILWLDTDIPGWVQVGGEYLIRITRTRASLTTAPKENKVQIAAVTIYSWDKDGDLVVKSIAADTTDVDETAGWSPGLGSFIAVTGSPVLSEVTSNLPAWSFDGAAFERIAVGLVVPADFSSGLKIVLAFRGASGTGNVYLTVSVNSQAAGEFPGSGWTAVQSTEAVTTNLSLATFDISALVANPGEYMNLYITRDATQGADTLDAVDMHLFGVGIKYTRNTGL